MWSLAHVLHSNLWCPVTGALHSLEVIVVARLVYLPPFCSGITSSSITFHILYMGTHPKHSPLWCHITLYLSASPYWFVISEVILLLAIVNTGINADCKIMCWLTFKGAGQMVQKMPLKNYQMKSSHTQIYYWSRILKRQDYLLFDVTYMWNLNTDTNECICRTETESQTQRRSEWSPQGSGEAEGT